ncbi:hypothetical protein BRARA_H01487 [Brassica rapa]|uniref:Uncharacterized protein n=1 Tax=Brassica campestris TaxID=3711 RepID=A0A397YIE8_BRACM|nr:hypothetical protein BRARA_H01487 [Brassica rapa]
MHHIIYAAVLLRRTFWPSSVTIDELQPSSSRSRSGLSFPSSPRNHQNIFLLDVVLCNSSPLYSDNSLTPRTSPTRSPTEPHISEARRELRQTSTSLQPSLVSKLYSASSSVSFLLLPSFRLIHISEAEEFCPNFVFAT